VHPAAFLLEYPSRSFPAASREKSERLAEAAGWVSKEEGSPVNDLLYVAGCSR